MAYALAGEDEKSYKVRHPKGHTFSVAKKGLSEEMCGRIRSMPKAMAEGGPVSDFTPPEEVQPGPTPDMALAFQQAAAEHARGQNFVPPPAEFAPTDDISAQAAAVPVAAPATPPGQPGEGAAAPQDPALAAWAKAQAQAAAPAPQGPTGVMAAGQFPIKNPLDYLGGVERRLNESQRLQASGIKGQAGAEQEGLAQQAQAAETQAAAQQQLLTSYQEHAKALWNEHEKIQQDVANTHIDPSRIWTNKGAAQKTSAILGMILGGMGQGVIGGENPALAILQREIDRDIDAQKVELGKKESLLADNLRKFGTLDAATTATRLQMQAVLEGQLKGIAARSGSKAAMAKADQMIGQTQQAAIPEYMKLGEIRAQFAYQSAMMSMVGGAGQQQQYLPSLAPPPLGKDISSPIKYRAEAMEDAAKRTMVGPGGKPFLAYSPEVAEKSRPMLQAADNVTGILQQMDKLRRTSSGVPGTQAARQYDQYRSALAEQWAMANGLTQPSEAMNKNLERVMPSSFDAFVRGGATFEPILRLIHERQKGIWQSAGLHPSAFPVLALPAR